MSSCPIDWKVCVRCYTFNHLLYIIDALNGFTMQQTKFPYVCCIVDDASKDNEQKVIIEYIDENFDFQFECSYKQQMDYGTLIFARHKTNHNCYFATLLLKENHNGSVERKALKRSYIAEWEKNSKYEAFCEGDDYWTDPYKLQKQVDFLESNPDYSMCFHCVEVKNEGVTEIKSKLEEVEDREYKPVEIFNNWVIPTCSVLIKTEVLFSFSYHRNFYVGDNVIWAACATKGRIRGFSKKMGVYRRTANGWTNSAIPKNDEIIFTLNKWIIHYRALKETFPTISGIFDNRIIGYMVDITLICKSMRDGSFKGTFFRYAREYGLRYCIRLFKKVWHDKSIRYMHGLKRC